MTDSLFARFLKSTGVSTDTRSIQKDNLFFALKGDNFNANLMASQALEKEAIAIVVDEKTDSNIDYEDSRVFLVSDVLKSLQKLANVYRKSLSIPIIAVCGSNGKTTTKELIHIVLSKKYKCFATKGNLNNHIGVPLSLLSIDKNTKMAVIEMGANHLQETMLLCNIAEPNYGLITNNGLDHLEGFGSIEGVIQANGELYDYLKKHKGIAFVNSSDKQLMNMATQRGLSTIRYPQKGDFVELELLPSDFFVKFKSPDSQAVHSQLFGDYNFMNIATAICVGQYFDVPPEDCMSAVQDYQPQNMRSQILKKNGNTILLDAYNANPSSMEAAIQNFANIKSPSKILILGDMLELGELSTREHQKLGELIAEYDFKTILLYGNEIQAALPKNPRAYYFNDKFSLHNWCKDHPLKDSYILIKGSRGVRLETVLDFI